MTTFQIAMILGVQHELVKDAAGTLYKKGGRKTIFTFQEVFKIKVWLTSKGRIAWK